MESSSSSEDHPKGDDLSNLLNKSRDELFIDLENYLIKDELPEWDENANSKLQEWITNASSNFDVSLSINMLKLMTSYIMNSAPYNENIVIKMHLKMLSMSSSVADCNSTERYTKISFWESITELNMALLEYNEELISRGFLKIGLLFISIVVDPSADKFLRQLYIKSINNLLEKYPLYARSTFKEHANKYLPCLPACLAEVGDYDFQTSIVECIFRTTGITERKSNIDKFFPGLDLAAQARFLRIQDFDPDCRHFLNKYNELLGDKQLVFTFPCQNAQIGELKLNKPKPSSYEKFWVDFNLRSGTILIMCDRSSNSQQKSNESNWESIVLYPNEVTNVTLSCLPHSTTLLVELCLDPVEIFATPPPAQDLPLLSEFITIEFSPLEKIKTVCQKLYEDKIIVHDMIPRTCHRKVSKTEIAIPSKTFSSSEAENSKSKCKMSSSSKQCKASKTKVPIPAVVENSSSAILDGKRSKMENVTTSAENGSKKKTKKQRTSKTSLPIICENDSTSGTSGTADEDPKQHCKMGKNMSKHYPLSKMEIKASTSKENVNALPEEINVNTINNTEKNVKSEIEAFINVTFKCNTIESPHIQENISNKCNEIQVYAGKSDSENKNEEAQIETCHLKMINIAQKDSDINKGISQKDNDTHDATLHNKNQLEETQPPLKADVTTESSSIKNCSKSHVDEEEKHMMNRVESINDSTTEIVQKEISCNKKKNSNVRDTSTNDSESIYPQTPPRDNYSKRKKRKIFGGNSQNKLAEIILSVSPEKKSSPRLSSETEKVYVMPTQDQGFLIEAMDTFDDEDLNKNLASTAIKIQNSEDEENVDIESEEEIPSSIATPSATTPLFNFKKNTELSVSRNNPEQKSENVKANTQEKEMGNDDNIGLENKILNFEDEDNRKDNECKTDSNSEASCNKADDEKSSKTKTLQKLTNIIEEKNISQSKDDNQHSKDIVSSITTLPNEELHSTRSRIKKDQSPKKNENIILNQEETNKKSVSTNNSEQKGDTVKANGQEKEMDNESNIVLKNKLLHVACEDNRKDIEECKSDFNPETSFNKGDESTRKENDSYIIDASNKEETQSSCSLQQSSMIDNLASKSLPSFAQFSYEADQLEDFVVDKTIIKQGSNRTKRKSIRIKKEEREVNGQEKGMGNESNVVFKNKHLSVESEGNRKENENCMSDTNTEVPCNKTDDEKSSKTKTLQKFTIIEEKDVSQSKDDNQHSKDILSDITTLSNEDLHCTKSIIRNDHSQINNTIFNQEKSNKKGDTCSPLKKSIVKMENKSSSKSPKSVSPLKNHKIRSCSKAENMSPIKDNITQDHSQVFKNVLPSRKFKSTLKESDKKSPVRELNKVTNEEKSPQGHKSKDDTSQVFYPKNANKKYKQLSFKIQPATRASSQLSGMTTPTKEKKALKAVVKVIESPKIIVDLTVSPGTLAKGVKTTIKSNSGELILSKSNSEDIDDIMHVTSFVQSPTINDLADWEQPFLEKQKQIMNNTIHDDDLLITTTVTAEVECYFRGSVRSITGKDAILSFSKELSILDQINGSNKGKVHKKRKRGLSDDDLIIHDATIDSFQPKTKSPRKEENKCQKMEKTISEGMKSTLKILETYPVNVLENKFNKNSLRKEEKTPVHGNRNEIKKEFDMTKKKRNQHSLASNVTPCVTIGETPGNALKDLKKTKKKLFNNSDINILQDTPPSSQSPDVEIASLYNVFNSESKSSPKNAAYSSKVNISKDTSFNNTTELSVYSTYVESTVHFSDEEMCDTSKSDKVSPLKQGCNRSSKNIRIKKEKHEEKSIGRFSPKIAVKKSRGRPKKILNVAQRMKKSNAVQDDLIDTPVFEIRKPTSKRHVLEEQKPTIDTHCIYSDFSSEDEFGWLKEKKNKPRIKVTHSYGKVNWSYKCLVKDSPEWNPLREKRHKRAELLKSLSPPESSHSTNSIRSDSTDDDFDMFKPVKPRKTTSIENVSGRRITRSFLKESSNNEIKQEISSKNKPLKRKMPKESSKKVLDLIQTMKSPEVKKNSWCDSVSRPESPDILRQNSCSSVESQTPGRDFKLAPSGRGVEAIKNEIAHSFGFSSPEITAIPEEPIQKRIRKSVDDANIKGILEGILPKAIDRCRNTNVGNNTSESGIYPLAPNNTPVSPVVAQKEESKRKENDVYMTDASDKEDTQGPCSPRQSTMIDDLASKSLPSLAQFSYVSEQLEDSFLVDKNILKSGYDTEEKSKKNIHASPRIKSPLNTKLHLSSGEDSPMAPQFLLPQQPWTPPMVDSDSEDENVDLNQRFEINELNTAHMASNEDGIKAYASPELFSMKTPIPQTPSPFDNADTQAFSIQESGEKNMMQSKHTEFGSLQNSESSNKNTTSTSPELFSLETPVPLKNGRTGDFSVRESAERCTMQRLCSLQSSESSNKNTSDFKIDLVANKAAEAAAACTLTATQENSHSNNISVCKSKTVQILSNFLDTYDKKETGEGASQLTPTSHQNPLETPEVSQRRLFLSIEDIGVTDFDSSSPLTPTQHRMIIQQMEEFKTHITVSYHKTLSLWENIMKLLGEKNK